MIGPGWMPTRPRPLGKKRWLPYGYAARRLRRKQAPVAHKSRSDDDQTVVFELAPQDLPVATVVSRRASPANALRGWLAARWTWLRPRTIPVMAAAIGLFLVVGSAKHLSRMAAGDEVAMKPCAHHKHHHHDGRIDITVGPPGATVTVDGKPVTALPDQPIKPGVYTVDLELK